MIVYFVWNTNVLYGKQRLTKLGLSLRVAGHFSVRTFLSSWNLQGRTILSSLIFRAGHFSVRWFAELDNSKSGHLSVGWFVGPVGSPTYGGSIVIDPFLTLWTKQTIYPFKLHQQLFPYHLLSIINKPVNQTNCLSLQIASTIREDEEIRTWCGSLDGLVWKCVRLDN